MASTYSTNLKLQLMATGENTGTWGSVTNTNLGTALEEAIVGSVDVTFSSADVTLSLTNTNANQTARNMRLVLVGTSGGARQLVVPAVEKIYIVKNELADTCTVKVSGQTGVAVPAGKTMWLCNDGTDVKDVVTHLSSLTLASPLPVGSGGTGATSLNGIAFTGENITNLNASNISSGTIANARTTASSSNGASTIVARGASGEFAAGVITADGSGLTALNASNISSGTIANARTTASSSNGASTIVTRDASGNFSAGTITATLNGNASTATSATSATSATNATNATNATQLATSRNFEISGGATASAVSFNGTGNVNLSVTGLNASSINAGTISTDRFPSGSVVKTQTYINGTFASFSGYTIIPSDNTIPQSSEGASLFSTTYTPVLSSGGILRIDFSVNMGSQNSQRNLIVALFSNLSSDALGCTYESTVNNGENHIVSMTTYFSPNTTSTLTFSLRGGDNGGNTIYINGNGSIQLFGGVYYSSITFTEYKA